MRRSMLSIMLVTLVLAMAVNAGAWDRLYTNDCAMTHDAGTFGVRGNLVYLMGTGCYDYEGEKHEYEGDEAMTMMGVPIDLYYSVMDQLEIGAQPIFWMNSMTDFGGEEYDATGLGDTWVDAKYMFMAEPMMTGRVGVKLPTGDDEGDEDNGPTGSGTTDFDIALMLGMPAGPGAFTAQAGYRMIGTRDVDYMVRETVEYKQGAQIHFLAGYMYPMSDVLDLKVAVDGFFGSEDEWDGETVDDSAMNEVSLNPGVVYMMDNGMDVGLDIHYVLMGQNVEATWGLGLWLGWSNM